MTTPRDPGSMLRVATTGVPGSTRELLAEARRAIVRVTPTEALAMQSRGAVLIDIRSNTAREQDGIVPGSVHVPRTVLEWRLDPTSRWRNPYITSNPGPLIILCDHGWSSSLAACTLARLGHDGIGDVIGGFENWRAAGLPVIPASLVTREPQELPGMGPRDGQPGGSDPTARQRERWEEALAERPDRYGCEASAPARATLAAAYRSGARDVLELGGGQGRDSLLFAAAGLRVTVVDFTRTAVATIRAKAEIAGVAELVEAVESDVRDPLPLADSSFDLCYSHMLFCMALSRRELRSLAAEVRRLLRPGGLCIYTARTRRDPDYGCGVPLGGGMFELNGFVVQFFDRAMVTALAQGYAVLDVEEFEEGSLPRRLFQVTMQRS